MRRYNPVHILKHLYRNPIFFSNHGGTDSWGHENGGGVVKKHWHPELTIQTGFPNGLVLDFGMAEGRAGNPWICARQVNRHLLKVYDSCGTFIYEKNIGGNSDMHCTRWWDINKDGKDELITYDSANNHSLVICQGNTGNEIYRQGNIGYRFSQIAIVEDGDLLTVDEYCRNLDKWHWTGHSLTRVGPHFGCNGVIEACHFPRSGYGIIAAGWYWFDYNMNRLRQPHQFHEWKNIWKEHCDGAWVTKDRVILSHQGQNTIWAYNHSGALQWSFHPADVQHHFHNMRIDERNNRIMFTEEGHNPPRVFMLDMSGHILPGFPVECVDQCQFVYAYSPDRADIYCHNGIRDYTGNLFFPFGQDNMWNQKQSYFGVIFKVWKDGRVESVNPPNNNQPNLVLSKERKLEQQQTGHRG